MQINGNRVLTLWDFYKGRDSKGDFVHKVVDLCAETNDFSKYAPIIQANHDKVLETTIRTSDAMPDWTAYYKPVKAAKGSKSMFKVTAATLASKIEVDARLYKNSPDKDAVILDETKSNIRGFNKKMGSQFIYGLLEDDPLGFNGLFKHYTEFGGVTHTDTEDPAHYVINAHKSGESKAALRSIALIGFGTDATTLFHPQHSESAGIEVGDMKDVDIDSDEGSYTVKRRYLYWNLGLAVRNFKTNGRLCNIPIDALLTQAETGGADFRERAKVLINKLRLLRDRVEESGVKQVFCMDKPTWEVVAQCFSAITMENAVTMENVEQDKYGNSGKQRMLWGIPVIRQDAMNVNEEEVRQKA